MISIVSALLRLVLLASSAQPGWGLDEACASSTCTSASTAADPLVLEEPLSVSLVTLTQALVQASASDEPQFETQDPAQHEVETQEARLARAKPMAWVHVPKCGTSFNNFLIHLPGVCPGVPEGTDIGLETFGRKQNAAFNAEYHVMMQNGSCPGAFSRWGDHTGAGPAWDRQYRGRAMTMLRTPEQRILSGFHYGYHSYNRSLPPPKDEVEYARYVQGCTVKMLTRGGHNEYEVCGGQPPPSADELALAIHRIRHDFAFIGITDRWALSICLGRRMFGGRCHHADFVDGRVTTNRQGRATSEGEANRMSKTSVKAPPLYDTAALRGWMDPYDGAVFEAAMEVFSANLQRFGVSELTCQPCFDEANVTMT